MRHFCIIFKQYKKVSSGITRNGIIGIFVECGFLHFSYWKYFLLWCILCLLHYLQYHWFWRHRYLCKYVWKYVKLNCVLVFIFMIQRTSYRSNWFNLMIYGNGVHVIGYMLLSAWLTTLLEKITKGDDAKCTECTLNKE